MSSVKTQFTQRFKKSNERKNKSVLADFRRRDFSGNNIPSNKIGEDGKDFDNKVKQCFSG